MVYGDIYSELFGADTIGTKLVKQSAAAENTVSEKTAERKADSDVPKTGDTSDMFLYIGIAGAALIAGLSGMLGRKIMGRGRSDK